MSVEIDFIFDFGSPNAYLAHKAVPQALDGLDYTLNIVPCLLGGIFKLTNNKPPMMAFGGVKGKLDYTRVEILRHNRKYSITNFRFNPHFPVNTLLLMRGAIAAENAGQLENYVDAGLKAMWEDGLKMDDPEVFVSTMNDAGLDGAALITATQDQKVKDKLAANTQAAVDRGTFGIPTFFVGDEMFFGKDSLGYLRDEVERRAG